jgi:hypothetical protein
MFQQRSIPFFAFLAATALALPAHATPAEGSHSSTSSTVASTRAAQQPRAETGDKKERKAPLAQPSAATPSEESRYARLEAESPRAASFEGGDTVIKGATTATVVLAIILLVVLL